MAACERCWSEARMRGIDYYEVMAEKQAPGGRICTPEEQCGDLHVLCVDGDTRCRCGARTAVVGESAEPHREKQDASSGSSRSAQAHEDMLALADEALRLKQALCEEILRDAAPSPAPPASSGAPAETPAVELAGAAASSGAPAEVGDFTLPLRLDEDPRVDGADQIVDAKGLAVCFMSTSSSAGPDYGNPMGRLIVALVNAHRAQPAETPSETPRFTALEVLKWCVSRLSIGGADNRLTHTQRCIDYDPAGKELEQENAVTKNWAHDAVSKAEAREQVTREKVDELRTWLETAVDIIDEIESLGMQSLTPKAHAEVAEMRKVLHESADLPDAGKLARRRRR